MLRLPKRFSEEIIEQARSEYPNEACGLLAGKDGEATRIYPMRNADRSPVIYRMEPQEQFKVFKEIDDAGLELVGIYHSHIRSPAYPSNTDVDQAYYPEAVYLIASLAEEEGPQLRGFRIVDGRIDEVDLEFT